MTELTVDEIDTRLDAYARTVMLELVLAWARYEATIPEWVGKVCGVPHSLGTPLNSQMDHAARLRKLEVLYESHDMDEAADCIKRLRTAHLKLVHLRNYIVQAVCLGQVKVNRNTVVFLCESELNGAGRVVVEELGLDEMLEATSFAKALFLKLRASNRRLRGKPRKRPPKPPSFLLVKTS